MQHTHPSIEGIYKPRGEVITVIDLAKYLDMPPNEDDERDMFIIAAFNNMNFAFHVHAVVGINRISWTQIQKPDPIIYGGEDGIATGVAKVEERLITILDFEKIISEISPSVGLQSSDVDKLGPRDTRDDKTILIAEDSMLLSKLITESLHRAGYTNTVRVNNGKEAWEYLKEAKAVGDAIENHVSCIISDIEMPQMDGHSLTKRIKSDSVLKDLPVVLFSSLITPEMRFKGAEVGADEQITKPEIANLVTLVDRQLALTPAQRQEAHAAHAAQTTKA